MERLTNTAWRNFDPWECCGQDHYCTRGCHDDGGCNNGCIVPKLYRRLAAYEDTGLEPEEIYEVRFLIAAQRDPQKLSRLSDLVLADQEGRLVVLPCKVGDTVYVIDPGDYAHDFKPYVRPKPVREISWKATSRKDLGWGLILSGGDCGTSARYKLSSIGKTVFLTREEAEAALKGGDDNA